MNYGYLIFTFAIILILLRVLYLRIKANGTQADSFKDLSPANQLSVLKECLLNSPSLWNFINLKKFLEKEGIEADTDSYKAIMDRQIKISKDKNAIAEDNILYEKECVWMDRITPYEFKKAEEARLDGNREGFIKLTLEGIARLYSDDAILKALESLSKDYPKATSIAESYRELMDIRDNSFADEKSLESLRKKKEAWERELLEIEL